MSALSQRNSFNPLSLENATIMRADYSSGVNPVYVGYAKPGTLSSEAKWQIRKMTWDGNNNVLTSLFADGVSDFVKIWDNRASYSYS